MYLNKLNKICIWILYTLLHLLYTLDYTGTCVFSVLICVYCDLEYWLICFILLEHFKKLCKQLPSLLFFFLQTCITGIIKKPKIYKK